MGIHCPDLPGDWDLGTSPSLAGEGFFVLMYSVRFNEYLGIEAP